MIESPFGTKRVEIYSSRTTERRRQMHELFVMKYSRPEGLTEQISRAASSQGLTLQLRPDSWPFPLGNTVSLAFDVIHGRFINKDWNFNICSSWSKEIAPTDDQLQKLIDEYRAAWVELTIAYAQSPRHLLHLQTDPGDQAYMLAGKPLFPTPELKALAEAVTAKACELFKAYCIYGFNNVDGWESLLDEPTKVIDAQIGWA